MLIGACALTKLTMVVALVGIKIYQYSKTCVKRPLSKRPKYGFQDQLSLNTGQKYCRMLPFAPRGAFCILLPFIKLPFVIEIIVLSIFEQTLKTGFIVVVK